MNPLTFVLPADRHLPSGGNIYNEHLIDALRSAAHKVEIINFADYQSAIMQDLPGLYWIDSLFIKDMVDLLSVRPQKALSFFILHHLTSLHPPPGQTSDQVFNRDEKAVLHFFNGFLVTSHFSKAYLKARGFQQPIIVVEPGIDHPASPQPPSASFIHALMVANLLERKGVLDWLTHLGKVTTSADKFTLIIVGRMDIEPEYAHACQQKVASDPALKGKVHFTGHLPHQEVLEYYARANLFISSARMETFGMALQEARNFGIPIVALDGGYTRNHVKAGVNGYIFNSTVKMANFFIDLVRAQAKFAALLEQTRLEQPVVYTWQQAAASFVQQFSNFFKTL